MRNSTIPSAVLILGLVGFGLVADAGAKDKGSPSLRSTSTHSVIDSVPRSASRAVERQEQLTKQSVPPRASGARAVPPSTIVSAGKDVDGMPTPAEPDVIAAPNAYAVDWQCLNAGAVNAISASYGADMSVGQSVTGYAAGSVYEVGTGFLYGISGVSSDCQCPYQCDFDENTFLDANDLNELIDALFFGGVNPQDPLCPTTRGDFNNDGFPDANDLNDLIDHLFFGGPAPLDPCD